MAYKLKQMLFPHSKLTYKTSTKTSALEGKIDISKTAGLSDAEEPSVFTGTYTEKAFTLRRNYRGGVNFFIPLVDGSIEDNTLSTKIRFTKATNGFLLFSIVLALFLLVAPFILEKSETKGLNIEGAVIILIPYFLGIIYFWYEYYIAKKFLLSIFKQV